jgi:acetylornithine deacetylase/succinyl-diaminopimelate desuccinylase-like protein
MLIPRVDRARLAELAYDLVAIPSPTGDGAAVAARYAEALIDIGLDVVVDDHFAAGPNVIGRWRGRDDGPTVSFVGHLDTIPAAHSPARLSAHAVHGRGADDMKGAMAAVVEAVRCLRAAGVEPAGDVVVAAHTLHEAPVGNMEGLRRLIGSGVLGDAAVVAESFPMEHQILAGKGQAVFAITVRRDGDVVHENYAAAGTVNPVDVAIEIAARLNARHRELAADGDLPLLGPETLFVGEIHGGDFYNRVPVEARISGIRRFGPARSWDEIDAEFAALTQPIADATGTSVSVELRSNGLGYTVSPDEPIAAALAAAHEQVTGRPLEVAGTRTVTDANIIVRDGGIPAVCYGANGNTGHADDEWVALDDLDRAASVFAGLVLNHPRIAAAGTD